MTRLLTLAVLLSVPPAGGYVYQMIYDCEYDDSLQNMVFFAKNVFNQQLNNIYDSRLGKYVGFGEYGMINAAHFNSQAWKMKERWQQVETLCRHNAWFYRRSTLDRKVPPVVRVRQTKMADYGERLELECSVWDFFPAEVQVSWLRDGQEVSSDVWTTGVLANGDWSFQLHSYLELIPRRGERVSCRVRHSSLEEEHLIVDWDTSVLDSKHNKRVVGIAFIFLGLGCAAAGAVYYWWTVRSHLFSPISVGGAL